MWNLSSCKQEIQHQTGGRPNIKRVIKSYDIGFATQMRLCVPVRYVATTCAISVSSY